MDTDRGDSVTVGTPVCAHNNSYVLETKARIDGSVRRRYRCRDCGKRFTVIREGERPGRPPRKPPIQSKGRKLTLEQIYRALTERQIPNKAMAVELGVSHQCIQQIRSGAIWPDAFPELPRFSSRRSCLKCKHWDAGECAIGFPDPLEEGPRFAIDCDFYEV